MIERPRLLPAVILGAMGLLALKLLAWTAEPGPGHIPVPLPLMAQAPVAKTVARAHAPGVFDPETTGSVPAPAPKTVSYTHLVYKRQTLCCSRNCWCSEPDSGPDRTEMTAKR